MHRSRILILAIVAAPALMLTACKKEASHAAAGPVAAAPPGGWVQQVAKTDDGGYRMGNPDAPVKIIEFGSRTCPHCAAFSAEGTDPLEKQYVATGRASYEFRDFAIHAPDVAAILLGRCTSPEAYFPLLEQMFADLPRVNDKLVNLPPAFSQSLQGKTANQQAAAWADYLGYTAFVGQRGVPSGKAQACLADTAGTDQIGKIVSDATQKFNVTGTPTFVVNGEVASGAHDWATLKTAIDGALGG